VPKHEFAPFAELIEQIRRSRTAKWSSIQDAFIEVVERFDAEFGRARRSTDWYQAMARFFNDTIVALLAHASSKRILTRKKKGSQLFGNVDVDICYPESDPPTILGEIQALGTPPHPKNRNQARSGSSDLHKRLREVAFTSMDLKMYYSPPQPIDSFQSWIDSTSPGYFSFWAIRASDDGDFERVRSMLSCLRAYCNGVAAVVYMPKTADSQTSYNVRKVPELDIDRAIRAIAQRISYQSHLERGAS